MVHYLIMCRSLTYAQKTARIIERAGISALIMRAPKAISQEGCAYCVKISQRRMPHALEALRRGNVNYNRIYIVHQNGECAEVAM